ncbi:MAG: ATP-binding protein [Pseudomonadota bacterium]
MTKLEIILSLFAISTAALLAIIVILYRKKLTSPKVLQPQFLQDIIDSNDDGYYFRNIKSGNEIFSKKLREMFALGDDKIIFTDFIASLGDTQSNSIKQALANLEKSIDTKIVINTDNNRQFECSLSGTYNNDKILENIIIWFRDNSESHKIFERINNETKQLKREVKQFSSILNSLPTPIWLRNSALTIKYCNMAYTIAAEEGTQESHNETLELHPLSRSLANLAFESNEIKSELRHIVLEGERKLYKFTEIPVKPDGITVGIAQDDTELEDVKEELQRYISVQSELLESVNSAMAVFGADMRLRFYNYAYVRLWGLDEIWLDTNPTYGEILEVLREKRRLPEQANFLQFKQQNLRMFTDLIESREEIFYLPDGRTLRVLAIPHALGGILFAYEDVTNILALERSYNTLIAVQKATLDNLHEAVVVFGEDGRLRLYNHRFLQIWKLEKAVLSPETHISDLFEKTKDLHYTDNWEQYRNNFVADLMTREVQHRKMERTDATFVDYIVVPLPDGATLITFDDVTDSLMVERSLRERNEALSEADRLKTEFLANVSYELRSPLTSISGFSEMLAHNYFGTLSEKQQEYISGIHESAQHLMNLINDILDISSIEAGYMKLSIGEFNIYSMLQSVISLVNERMREHNLKFKFECLKKIGIMIADETRIKQIIFNLLSNSIKYSNSGGKISLKVSAIKNPETEEEEILFVVEDNGIGIAVEEQEEIFDKFRKGRNSRVYKSGAGLGLSMVRSFVILHGGRVELSSTPDEGTKISCYLPRKSI